MTFDFTVDLSRLSRPGIVEAYPSTGKVAAGEKTRVKLKVRLSQAEVTYVPALCVWLPASATLYRRLLPWHSNLTTLHSLRHSGEGWGT